MQKKEETLADWADRVKELAERAFKKLPNEFCCKLAAQRFYEDMYGIKVGTG